MVANGLCTHRVHPRSCGCSGRRRRLHPSLLVHPGQHADEGLHRLWTKWRDDNVSPAEARDGWAPDTAISPVLAHLRLHQEGDRRARRVDIMQMDSARVNNDGSQMHPRAGFVLQQPVLVRKPIPPTQEYLLLQRNPKRFQGLVFGFATSEPSRAPVLLQLANPRLALRTGK